MQWNEIKRIVDDKEFNKLFDQSLDFIARNNEEEKGNGNGDNREDKGSQGENASKGKSKRNFMAYKYFNRKKGDLHEAVILSGKPAFLKCENGSISAVEKIEEDIRTINPLHAENYPYEPYEFKDIDEP